MNTCELTESLTERSIVVSKPPRGVSFKFSLAFTVLVYVLAAPSNPAQSQQGMDFFFNRTCSESARKPVNAPFPKFPAGQAVQSPSTNSSQSAAAAQIEAAQGTIKQKVVAWFEKLDDLIFTQGATDREKYILKRPINKEVERLNEWVAAAGSVARKYRSIAAQIRNLKPPQPELKELQSESADWYDDNAQLCEDLTAPRPPAKTYEELERAYKGFMTRSKNLVEVSKSVTELSTRFRQKYDVHQPKYVDEAAKFVDSATHNLKG